MVQGLIIDRPESFERPVSVCERLKIGDEFLRAIAALQVFKALMKLFFDGETGVDRGTGAGAPSVTKDTAPIRNGAIPIGAVESCVKGYLLNSRSEYFP